KPCSIAGENAFSRSGRLRVNQATPSSVFSKRSVICRLLSTRSDRGHGRPSLAAYPTCVLGEYVVAPARGAYPRGTPREAVLAGEAIAMAASRDRPLRSDGAGRNEEEEEWRMICLSRTGALSTARASRHLPPMLRCRTGRLSGSANMPAPPP